MVHKRACDNPISISTSFVHLTVCFQIFLTTLDPLLQIRTNIRCKIFKKAFASEAGYQKLVPLGIPWSRYGIFYHFLGSNQSISTVSKVL